VIAVIAADDEQDPIRIADDSPYWAGRYHFHRRSRQSLERGARRGRARSATTSCCSIPTSASAASSNPEPAGGGRDGILPYLESKTVILASAPSRPA